MKCIISFVTKTVETSSNAELGWYMKIIKPNKRTMTHTLLSSKGVVRKWSSVQGLCPTLIPHPVKVISNRRIAPTTQVSFKITGSCNVWGQVNIIYSLNSNFGFKQKINYLGVGFFMFFFFGCSLLLSADYKTSFLTDLNYMLLDWMTRHQLLCLLES